MTRHFLPSHSPRTPARCCPVKSRLSYVLSATTTDAAARLYTELSAEGFEVLWDDRNDRAGVKFNDADLMGHPWQLIVGPRGAAAGKVELKRRAGGERLELTPEEALARIGVGRRTALVTMTHDPKIDDPALAAGLRSAGDVRYEGLRPAGLEPATKPL